MSSAVERARDTSKGQEGVDWIRLGLNLVLFLVVAAFFFYIYSRFRSTCKKAKKLKVPRRNKAKMIDEAANRYVEQLKRMGRVPPGILTTQPSPTGRADQAGSIEHLAEETMAKVDQSESSREAP